GGPPETLCDAANNRGGSWGREGVIIFAPGPRAGFFRVSSSGGQPVSVTSTAPGQMIHRWPSFLPDGRHFLFLGQGEGSGDASTDGIYVGSLDKETPSLLLLDISNSLY